MSVRFSPPSFAWALPLALLAALGTPARAQTPPAAAAKGPSFLIVNPAGRGNQGMAEGFLADFAKALQASWPEGEAPELRGRYHVSDADALASIRREPPVFALVSAGFYLDHRRALDLRVLAVPIRREGEPVVRILAREAATPARPPRLGGQLAGEPGWLMGVVIGQDRSWLSAEPVLVPVAKTLEAVRMAEAGQLDYIALHDAEWQVLRRTGKGQGWRVVATSAALPEGPLVSLGAPDALATAAALSLSRFPQTQAGQAILARMTLRGFEPADDALFEESAAKLAAWQATGAAR